MNTRKKTIIIGPLPPPLGGVSVHLYRYTKILEQNRESFEAIDFDQQSKLGKILSVFKIVLFQKSGFFYVNTYHYLVILALLIRPFHSEIVFFDHNFRFLESLSPLWKKIYKQFFNKTTEIYAVSDKVIEYYVENKFNYSEKTKIINPFYPPPPEDEDRIYNSYSSLVKSFATNHKPLLLGNASSLVFYQGVDLYGLDLCVDLVVKLKQKFPEIGIIFAISNETTNHDYFIEQQQRIKQNGISDNFIFITGNQEIWPLFKRADLFVRPTYTDGNAISILEALNFNCHVIASDVGLRPPQAIQFKNRDLEDLYQKSIIELNKIKGSN